MLRVGEIKVENAKDITKDTKDQMLEFLRSDESLHVYSNSQELLGIANMYNIIIDIFTFWRKRGSLAPSYSCSWDGDWSRN